MSLSQDNYDRFLKGFIANQKKRQEEELSRQEQAYIEQQQQETEQKDSRGLLSKVYDQVNVLDNGRSFSTEKPGEDNKKDNAEQLGDIGRNFFGNTAKLANTVGEGARQLSEGARVAVANATDNKEARQAALDRAYDKEKELTQEGRGVFGKGGFATNEDLNNMSAAEFAKTVAGGGLGVAGEVAPSAKLAKGASTGLKLARAGSEGVVLGAGGQLGEELTDKEAGVNFGRVGTAGVFGTGLSVGSEIAGTAISKARNKKPKLGEFDNATPAGLVDDPKGVGEVADDLAQGDRLSQLGDEAQAAADATRKSEFDAEMGKRDVANAGTVVDENKLLGAGESARPLAEVDAEINRLQTEGDPNLSVTDVKKKWDALQVERKAAELNEAERGFTMSRQEKLDQFNNNGLPNDIAGAEKALQDLVDGNVDLPTTRDPKVKAVTDIFAQENMPVELKAAATELMDDMGLVQRQLDGLMTKDKFDAAQLQMDDAYKARMAEIEDMPGPRQELELQKLDDQYLKDVEELANYFDGDAQMVEQNTAIMGHLMNKEQQLVTATNALMDEAPDKFRSVDPAEKAARETALKENLEQAKAISGADNVVADIASSPDPVKSFNSNPDAPKAFVESATANLEKMAATPGVKENFRHLNDVTLATSKILSPSKWLEKMGLRNDLIDLHTPVVQAVAAMGQANKFDLEALTKIAENIPNNIDGQRQIIDFIEGKRTTLTAFSDKQAAESLKEVLLAKRAELDSLGFKTLDDYFPHVFDVETPEIQRLFDPKSTGNVNFGNLKERLTDGDDYSRDIMQVMTEYVQGVNRKIHMEPAIKPLADLRNQVDLSSGEAKLVDDYVKQLLGQKRSAIGESFNTMADAVFKKMGLGDKVGTNHYGKSLGTQRLISAVGTMGLNPGTAVRNLTQVVNTVTNIGPKYSLIGAMEGTRMLATKAGREELTRAGILNTNIGRSEFTSLAKPGLKTKAGGAVDKATSGIMSLIEAGEVSMRSQAYAGAKAKALKRGLSVAKAEEAGIRAVVDTQFLTSAVDMPLAMNGQGVRSLAQFATFSAKQAEFLKESGIKVFKNQKGEYQFDPKQLGAIIAGVSTAYAATEALKPLMGFREEEWIPFYDQIAPYVFGDEDASGGIYRSPLVNMLAGDGKNKEGLLGLLSDARKGELPEGLDNFWGDFWTQLVPAGTQAKKTYEGITTTTTGESLNKNGNIRYLQDMGIDNTIKAGVFGQYSTEAGQNWIKEGFPTLSDSQTAKVNQQDTREMKEQYADFYAARKKASGRQEAYDGAKEAIRAGDVNKAARLAKEYNDKVTETMKEYWAKHQEMPKELQDEMLSGLYINIGNIEK